MPITKQLKVPSYRHHKPSGRAVVTIDGKDYYLGKWNTDESKQTYDRLITEWLAGGRRLATLNSAAEPTIIELIACYWRYAEGYYRKNGQPTDEIHGIRAALRPLKRLYGRQSARDFGPLALKAVRQVMIDEGKSRSYINDNVARVKRMFRWAVENELVAPAVHHGLQAVPGLRRGRSKAREPAPTKPVPNDLVDATLPHLSPVVTAMIELQRLTGMRSGELTIIRGCDLDTNGQIWVYTPATHKTEHHGHSRPIYLGPRAQEVIRPFLKADLSAYLFCPRESEEIRNERKCAARKTPMTPSQAKRRPKQRPKRTAGDHYTTDSYRRAVIRGCDKAFPSPDGLTPEETEEWRKEHRWHPHQLRHSAATRLRKEFGLEAARVVLGHRSAAVTDLYAEVDHAKAADIMAKVVDRLPKQIGRGSDRHDAHHRHFVALCVLQARFHVTILLPG